MALAAYRNILRAARIAFQGDGPTLTAAQGKIRHEFRQQTSLKSSSSNSQAAIEHAQEVARFLRENLVQGEKVEGKGSTYKLRIHEYTKKGDNETIKAAGSGTYHGGCACS